MQPPRPHPRLTSAQTSSSSSPQEPQVEQQQQQRLQRLQRLQQQQLHPSCVPGVSKAARVSHLKAVLSMSFFQMCGATSQDVLYVTLPLYHMSASLLGVGGCVHLGETWAPPPPRTWPCVLTCVLTCALTCAALSQGPAVC